MSENKTQKSVGAVLKEARLSKKADIETVSKATKIHARILTAMEDDAFESLGSVYARGFLKLYAEYLGLDKETLAQRALAASGLKDAAGVKKSKISSGQKTAPSLVVSKPIATGRASLFSFQTVVISIAFLAVFVLGVKWMTSRAPVSPIGHKKEAVVKRETKKSLPRDPKASQAVKTTAVKPAEKKSSTPSQVAAAKTIEIPKSSSPAAGPADSRASAAETKLVLVVRAKNKTWLQVKADGKIVFQTILPKGASESWQAKDKLELWVGDAGSLDLEFNGRLLGKIGRPGQILRHVVLTRNGLSIQK